jgi:mannose/fructose/N-acetylgalactosamine-specific phosphotransferase system component IIB
MKTKTKSKIKKNKIPICPKKEKPVKKIIKIIPKNHNIKHFKHPSTPSTIFKIKYDNNINHNNFNNEIMKNDINNKNLFQFFIPKRNIVSEKKPNRKKQKINLIINKPNNIDKTEKEFNNIFNLCNLNIREEENMKNNKNMLEFTFGDIKDIKRIEERKFDVKNYNKNRTNYSFHKRNNKNNYESNKISNIKKCNSIKNINIKFNSKKNKLKQKNISTPKIILLQKIYLT